MIIQIQQTITVGFIVFSWGSVRVWLFWSASIVNPWGNYGNIFTNLFSFPRCFRGKHNRGKPRQGHTTTSPRSRHRGNTTRAQCGIGGRGLKAKSLAQNVMRHNGEITGRHNEDMVDLSCKPLETASAKKRYRRLDSFRLYMYLYVYIYICILTSIKSYILMQMFVLRVCVACLIVYALWIDRFAF
jgi:hypothetical protein